MSKLVLNTKNLSAAQIETKSQALNAFGDHAAKLVKKAIQAGSEAFNLHDLATKALTISGSDGESLAIDDVLGRSIIEAARERVTILGLVAMKNVSSKAYREMVLKTYPAVGETTEQVTGTDWALTDTQTYEEVVAQFAKKYAKPLVSTEAMDDPAINLYAHLQSLLVEEVARTWAQEVIAGDGSANHLRGILGYRVNETEGVKSQLERDNDSYPIIYSGVDAELGNTDPTADGSMMDVLIDMTTAVPSKYLSTSYFLMNRRTMAKYRKLKDTRGLPLLQWEESGFTLLGFPVFVEDYWPDVELSSFPVMFGDLSQAFALINYSEHYLVDPYTVDGAVQIKATTEKGDIVQNNDAVVFLCASDGVA